MTRAMRMVMLLMPAWYKMMMWRNRWRMRKRITNLARTMYNYGYTYYKCFSADGCGNEGIRMMIVVCLVGWFLNVLVSK